MTQLPANSRALCRRMAFKSRLGFGRYADATVQDLLKVNEGEYLLWAYYNLDMVDFLPEVKEAIGITESIPKPGKNPELGASILHDKHCEEWRAMTTEEKRIRGAIRKRLDISASRARLADARREERLNTRRCVMQAANQGKL